MTTSSYIRQRIKLITLLTLLTLFIFISYFLFKIIHENVLSVSSFQWWQQDWSNGVGSNTTNEYQSATNIDNSTVG